MRTVERFLRTFERIIDTTHRLQMKIAIVLLGAYELYRLCLFVVR